MQKKSVHDFLDEVIIPIEKTQVDDGKVYVLIRSFAKHDLPGSRTPGLQYEENEIDWKSLDKWSLPKSGKPGEWHKIESSSGLLEKFFRLNTLSGILWHGDSPGNLYRVEYADQRQKLGLEDYVYFGPAKMSDEQQMEVSAQSHIDDCIQLGIESKKCGSCREWRIGHHFCCGHF